MKYRVRLTSQEREVLRKKVSSGSAPAREIQHAQILLKVDGGLVDRSVAEAVGVSSRTVQRIRQRCSRQGIGPALSRKAQPPRPGKRKITDEMEARLIAVACSDPPEGRSRWTLRLLSAKAVELGLSQGPISHECIRQALKKTSFDLTASRDG